MSENALSPPALNKLLAWLDNKRRVTGRNVSDLWGDPSNATPMMADRMGQTIIEHFQDPMNFVGGGTGSMKLVGGMRIPTPQNSHVAKAMADLAKRKGVSFSDVPDNRGLYAVTVDGTPVFYEKSLYDAHASSKSVDADFWRGEMKNWGGNE